MWSLKSISAEDFLSHEKTEIEVKQRDTTLIYGKNLTDRGVESNGSGKSCILEMVYFCMTGNSLRKSKNKELIRNGQDKATITLVIENPVIGMSLRIVREILAKKATTVKLYENDVLREDLEDLKPAETSKVILEYLEISASDLANYYLISKEKYASLLLSSDTQKKEVINRFSKADYIDAVFPQIELDAAEQQNVVNEIIKAKASCSSKIELLQEQVSEAKVRDMMAEKAKRVESLKERVMQKMGGIQDFIKEEEAARKNLESYEERKVKIEGEEAKLTKVEDIYKEIDEIEKMIGERQTEFNLDTRDEMNASIQEVSEIIKEVSTEVLENKGLLRESEIKRSKLDKIILGEIECPSCSHKFLVGEVEMDLEECKEQLEIEVQVCEILATDIDVANGSLKESRELKEELEKELEDARVEFKEEVRDLNDKLRAKREEEKRELGNRRDIANRLQRCLDGVESQQRMCDRANRRIEELEGEIKEIKGKIFEINEEPDPTIALIKKLGEQIKEQESLIIKNGNLLEVETEKLDEITEWKVNFKRFKSFLANQSLTLIEQQANHFLDKMKCDNRVVIDGFRELANGKMKEEISIEISRDNLTTESFGKFSGGEKAKVDLSCILSMQTLINTSCKNGGLDLLFCDEILESADGEAMGAIATSLNDVDKTVFMIAQSQPNVDCSMLEVTKENKISNITSYN